MARTPASKTATRSLVDTHRAIQRSQDAKDRAAPASRKKTQAVQAGARVQPETLTGQKLAKPGREKDMALRPRYTAPGYQGSGKLAEIGRAHV